jgi:chromosome segregation ATPase
MDMHPCAALPPPQHAPPGTERATFTGGRRHSAYHTHQPGGRASRSAQTTALEETQKEVQETKEGGNETKKQVQETKKQVQETKKEVQETRQVAHETKQELVKGQEETKHELAVLSAVQEVANQRMTTMEAKMDKLIGLLKPGGGEGT